MIYIQNLSKSYRHISLFKHLNVTFSENKKIMITGENGCGKSVLLKMIVGYALADDGRVLCDDKQIGKDCDFIPLVGTFINAPEFVPYLTGLENLEILQKIQKRCSVEELSSFIKLFKMEDIINNKYKTYSLGSRQKLRIIQALMDKPNYLILDEPFDSLDTYSKDILLNLLNDFIKINNHSLIYTSHINEMQDFADEIYRVENFNLVKIK